MHRLRYIFCLILIMCFFMPACGLLNKMKQDFKHSEGLLEDNIYDEPIVVMETPEEIPTLTTETKLITLYFADPLTKKLVSEEREIAKVTGIARATLEELIKGPLGLNLEPTIPANTKLLDINVRDDGLAIVDFSGDLIRDLPISVAAEELAVFSIVNTLTQFPTVEEVELRVEGQKMETLLGYLQWEETLIRDVSLIE